MADGTSEPRQGVVGARSRMRAISPARSTSVSLQAPRPLPRDCAWQQCQARQCTHRHRHRPQRPHHRPPTHAAC